VVALEVEDTRLERKGDRVVAVGTGALSRVPCDTVVFAVGDRVDEHAGLPYQDGLYLTGPASEQDPAAAYQVWEPRDGRPMDGVFVVGWARRASDGVVGRARLDAETGIKHVLAYLSGKPRRAEAEAERVMRGVGEALSARGAEPVTYADVQTIEAEERRRAAEAKVEEFKFASNREMLALIRR
jgi:ferredoxin--NADP+ reductase